jgi:hypothetical protein
MARRLLRRCVALASALWQPIWAALRSQGVDLVFVTLLLALAAVPLVLLRGSPVLADLRFVVGFPALCALTALGWLYLGRRSSMPPTADGAAGANADAAENSWGWGTSLLVGGLLLALTIVSYALPLRKHFWGGADEFVNFDPVCAQVWSAGWDAATSRPIVGLCAVVAKALTPGRIEGFLALAVALCFLNGLLLLGIVRRLVPAGGALAVSAAALLIVHRGDASRFFVLWTTNYYWTTLFLLLLSVWLYLRSYERGSKPLLLTACATLGAAILSSEASLPLAALGPGLLWFIRRRGARLTTWVWAWTGTVALLATRLALFLKSAGANSYQSSQIKELLESGAMAHHLRLQFDAFRTFFQGVLPSHAYWLPWAVALLLVAAVLRAVAPALRCRPSLRAYLLGALLAGLAALGGIAPFFHLPTLFRTQFFAAPGEAALLACAIGLLAALLPLRLGRACWVACTGLLVAGATAAAHRSQDQLHTPISFEKTVHVLEQVRAASVHYPDDALLVFVLEGNDVSPLGQNYPLSELTRNLLGVRACQANYRDPYGSAVQFTEGAVVGDDGRGRRSYGYDRVVAFRLALDGTATLLRHLPASLLPRPGCAERYDPLALLQPGPVTSVPYFRYPFWSRHWQDVVPVRQGVVLGEGWGRLEVKGNDLCRRVSAGAEVVVNSLGLDRRELVLDVEPATDGTCELRVLDRADRIVARSPLVGRQRVRLDLPTAPGRVEAFRLVVAEDGGGPAVPFRLYRRGAARGRPDLAAAHHDIGGADFSLGRNWHGLEWAAGEPFHWAANDAELIVGVFANPCGRQLALDLEPGPGMAGQPCRIQLLDAAGRAVAATELTGRQVLHLPLPPSVRPGTVLRLHVAGGGAPVPGEARVLNFRVFACRWVAQEAETFRE